MGAISDQVKKLTTDMGARWLGGVIDGVMATLTSLEEKVAACCDDDAGLRARATAEMDAKLAAINSIAASLETRLQSVLALEKKMLATLKAIDETATLAPSPTPLPADPENEPPR